jgi:hypothetical protein
MEDYKYNPCDSCVRSECKGCRIIGLELDRCNFIIEGGELQKRIKELEEKLKEGSRNAERGEEV